MGLHIKAWQPCGGRHILSHSLSLARQPFRDLMHRHLDGRVTCLACRLAGHAAQVLPRQDRRGVERDEAGSRRGDQQAGGHFALRSCRATHPVNHNTVAEVQACRDQLPNNHVHAAQVNGRIIPKRIHVRIEHVHPSRCKEEFLRRVKANDEFKHEAKLKGGACSGFWSSVPQC